jgi:hypothetical protein
MMEIHPAVRNSGKTMAQMVRASIRAHTVRRPGDLPEDPVYDRAKEFNIQLPPGAAVQPILTRIDLREFTDFRQRKSTLYIYGYVDYRDLSEKERQTRFCFEYVVPGGFSGAKRGFYMSATAPKKYTECT